MEIVMMESDFENLWSTSMGWGKDWEKRKERFETPISYHWKMAYWFSSYSSLLIARSWLLTNGHETQTTFDTAMDEWLIVTDYGYERLEK